MQPESELNEFEPRLKSRKNRFQLSAGLNIEALNKILSGNQPYLSRSLNLSRGSNSLNSVLVVVDLFIFQTMNFVRSNKKGLLHQVAKL